MIEPSKFDSKKYTMVVFGLIIVIVVFAGSAVLLLFKPSIASSVTPLAQVVVTAVSGLVGVYCASQAAVDWKTAATPPVAPVPPA